MTLQDKYKNLKSIIKSYGRAAVAFSGGVDSSFLSRACFDILGSNSAAITIVSIMNPKSEIDRSHEIAALIGIPHYLLYEETIEDEILRNPPDRCYHCKKMEFSKIIQKASGLNIGTVVDGSNFDDLSDYRPGMRALKELGVKSPLREAGLSKKEIRELSRNSGLPTWDKPSFACLASRIPYEERITKEKLLRVDRSEEYLRKIGFIQFRVRSHGDLARIEVSPEERPKMLDLKIMDEISSVLKSFGFIYVSLDLEGYKTGSMNRLLEGRF